MRCLVLADALRERGAECQFICREHEGNLLEQIRQRGFAAYGLPICVGGIGLPDYNNEDNSSQITWSGTDWSTDAAQTKLGAGERAVDWLIVDHYALDARWERLMRPICRHLMVIDDIANRPHHCDLLVDQNYEDEERYKEFVAINCRLLLGPRYALLRPEYAEHRASKNFEPKSISRVLIYFGGSDPQDLTGTTLKALSTPRLSKLEVDIVVGANYVHSGSLRQHSLLRGKTTVYQPRVHLADLMASADIAIGAGGVTNWERMCLGLPSLVVTVAENQTPISEILNQSGAIRLIGKSGEVTESHISAALLDEIQSRRYINRIAPAMASCDGLGVARVLSAMDSFS